MPRPSIARKAGAVPTIDADWKSAMARLKGRSASKLRGPRSGFDLLDSKLRGIHGVSVLGGMPGVGKTTLALQIASQTAELEGTAVLWASAEMHRHDVLERLAARMAFEQDSSTTDFKALKQRFAKVGAMVAVDDGRTAPLDLCRSTRKLMKQTSADHGLLVVDSLQAVVMRHGGADGTDSMKLSIDGTLDDMYQAAYRGGFAVLLISHVPKGMENRGGVFGYSGSGGIDYLADTTLQLVDPLQEDGDDEPDPTPPESVMRELRVIKQRFGSPCRIDLEFLPAEHRFKEQA